MKSVKHIIRILLELVLVTLSLVIALPIHIVLVAWDFVNCVMKTILFMIGYTPKYVGLAEELFDMRCHIDRFAIVNINYYKKAIKGEYFSYVIKLGKERRR